MLDEAATRQHLRTAVTGDEAYARGWMVSDAFPLGEPIITHDGSNTVNYASIVIAPKRGLALMTVCNAGDPAAQGAAVDAMLIPTALWTGLRLGELRALQTLRARHGG